MQVVSPGAVLVEAMVLGGQQFTNSNLYSRVCKNIWSTYVYK